MRSYPIYCKFTRDYGDKPRVQFGAQHKFDQTISVGTSGSNSHKLAHIVVRKHVAPDDGVMFSLTIDGHTVKRGHLLDKVLHVYDIKAGDR